MVSIRRDEFEIYKEGVRRLQELRTELEALHAEKKFSVEFASILAKLKNVADIPKIEFELSELKKKISGKFVEKKETLLKNFDPFVDSISNNMFSLSFEDIKLRLAEEFKRREEILKEDLRKELKKKHNEYFDEYKKVEKKFEEDYNRKLETRLAFDAKKNLAAMAEEIAEKKAEKMHKSDLKEFRRKKEIQLELEKKRLTESFISDFENAKDTIQKDYEKQLQVHRKELDLEFSKKISSALEELKGEYHNRLTDLENKKKRELKEAVVSKTGDLESKKKNEIEMLHRKENELTGLIGRTKQMQNEFEKKKKELEIERKKNSLLIADIKKKLNSEYEKRLNAELARKESEFRQKINRIL